MTKKLKLITTYIVLSIMVIGIFPVDALANAQSPVTSGLTLISKPSDAGYNVVVEWTSPFNTKTPGVESHNTEGYDLQIENIVTGKKETTIDIPAVDAQGNKGEDPGGIKYAPATNLALENGYLYRYSVIPYHFHTTIDATGRPISVRAPMDASKSSSNQAFFLTDLAVGGTGEGHSITVEWDNPSPLIKSYKISYNKIITGTETPAQGRETVSIDNPNLNIINSGDRKKYSYTITNENVISSANMYDVIVEPIFNGGTYEEAGKNISVTENNIKLPVTVREETEGKYTTVITTDLPLKIEDLDDKKIILIWSGLDEATISSTDKLEILQSTSAKFENYTIIGTLYNDGCRIGSWPTPKPKITMYYKIVVTFKKSEDGKERPPMTSKVVEFNPSMIPFTPNKPDILEVKPIIQPQSSQLNMTWSAFIRAPYNEDEIANTENKDGKTYVDKDVTYDIWVADDVTGLYDNSISPILANLSPDTLNNVVFVDENKNSIIAYNTLIPQYSKKTDKGYVNVNIIPNTLYYIKIITKKTFNETVKISEPEYLLVYFNESGNVFLPPMMSKPPLKVKKDENGKDMIGKTDVSIEWKKSWWEIYNPELKQWESKFKVENGKVVFRFEGDGIIIRTEEDMKNKVLNLISEEIYYRPIVFDNNVKYELMLVPYTEIEKFAKENYEGAIPEDKRKIYDDYIKKNLLALETPTTSIFTEITNPEIDKTDSQGNTLYTTITGLTPNTEYVILFRAYRTIVDEVRLKSDPTYITITTLPVDKDIVEVPTVPSLYLKEKDDISITVKWRDDGFKYELVVSEKPLVDPGTGTIITSEEIEKNGVRIIKDTEIGDDAMIYKINGLFPETQYYIWIRAISPTVKEPSAWSSPLQVSTDILEKPEPPSGLGLASKESLLYVNDADGTKYVPSTEKYLIFEWMKDAKDTSEGYASQATADAVMLGAPEIKSTMLAMYQNLIANKRYYVRVATRVVVVKGGEKGITKKFSYIIQVADNEEFKDFIQIEIPEEFKLTDANTYRMQISDFCTPKSFLTLPSDNEYDAGVDPSLYPLPDEDFELIYDAATFTLTHRLRSNEKGKDGMPDNRVDQRVITKMVQRALYTYPIDVSKYNNKIIKNRVVEIPYTLLDSFRERKVNVQIKAANLTLTLTSQWLSNEQAKTAIGYGDSSKLRISLSQGITMPTAPNYYTNSTQYISDTQQLNMVLQTPKSTNNIAYTAEPMVIQMKLNNRYDMYDKNIDTYMYNTSSAEWERMNADYDSQNAEMKFSTSKVSTYTALAISAPSSSESSEEFKLLSNKINVIDMRNYKSNQSITANQLNNLMYSIAMDKKDVELNKSLTSQENAALTKAGLVLTKTGDSSISRQEAINSIVRLYELKTKTPINVGGVSDSGLSDIDSVAPFYQMAMLKAEEIGFLKDESISRPNDEMTVDEAAYMMNIILNDTI